LVFVLKKTASDQCQKSKTALTNKQKTTFIFIEGFVMVIKKALLDGLPKGLIVNYNKDQIFLFWQ